MRYPCIMTNEDAEQLALDGLAPRKRRKRAPAVKTPAAEHPIAQVVLDIQATHLGQTFDYFVEEKYSAAAQPGVMVRVRFGGQRVNGIIWKRADTSATPESSIRYIERVVTDRVLVPESMRDDMTRIADAFGGTRANILRLAVPPRVAKVEASCASAIAMPQEPRRANNGSPPSTRRYTASCNVNTATSICCMTRCKADVSNRSSSTCYPVPTIGGAARHGWWPRRSLRTSRRCWCCRPCGRSPT